MSKSPKSAGGESHSSGAASSAGKVLRFAHPFFTTEPPAQRTPVPGVGMRMTDYIVTKLEPIPAPQREPTMVLADIIGPDGVKAIEETGSIIFHAVGDTGEPAGNTQERVADAMTADYNISSPQTSPAFFLHLGDVNYYNNTDTGYHEQFYAPYKNYPGKIIAIPGNHDGELFKYDGTSVGQTTTLQAFLKNFCQPKNGVPPAAGTIYREMISQPGVYWYLNAPFVDIIGLYSNVAENPGYISGSTIGNAQKDWLTQTLKTIDATRKRAARKALLVVVHHPPISTSGHSSSTEMLADIDDSCTKAGIMPDALLAGHAHNYQRFTRLLSFNNRKLQIPFLVVGTGGRVSQSVLPASGKMEGDHTFDKSLRGYGYLTVAVTPHRLTLDFYQVDTSPTPQPPSLFDTVSVSLDTNQVIGANRRKNSPGKKK